jgi:hypothetical protein
LGSVQGVFFLNGKIQQHMASVQEAIPIADKYYQNLSVLADSPLNTDEIIFHCYPNPLWLGTVLVARPKRAAMRLFTKDSFGNNLACADRKNDEFFNKTSSLSIVPPIER